MTTAPQPPQCGGKLYSTADGMVHMSILPNQHEPWPACRVSDESLADMQVWRGRSGNQLTTHADPRSEAITCSECLHWREVDEVIAYQMLAEETHRDGQLDDGRLAPVHDLVAAEVLTVPSGLLDVRHVDLSDEELATLKQRFIDSVSGASRWFDAAEEIAFVTKLPERPELKSGDWTSDTPPSQAELDAMAERLKGSVLDTQAESLLSIDQHAGLNAIRDYENCDRCNYDTHRCPGCGEPLVHGVESCNDCSDRIAAEAREGVEFTHGGMVVTDRDEHDYPEVGGAGVPFEPVTAPVDGPNWCHVHNRVEENGSEERKECFQAYADDQYKREMYELGETE